ncbi:MAG: hypothetical protein JWO62_1503 [Acidimicrobiaceae bacterium]|jgi:hypothetical protein|nr:hypothetical protein [Acidimicrobiaceae bacterium]
MAGPGTDDHATPEHALDAAHGDLTDDFSRSSTRAIAALLDELPELRPLVQELGEILHEDLSAQCVFAELAGVTSQLFGGGLDEEDEERLERIFAAVEVVATTEGVDTTETIAFSFLDGLDPDALARARAYLGPASEHILEQLVEGVLELG